MRRDWIDGVALFALLVLEYVPFLAGNDVYLGHWAQTVNFQAKPSAAAAASAAATRAPRPTDGSEVTRSTGAWSKPIWLSRRYSSAWFPDIAADSSGGVHVFWAANGGGRDLVAYCLVGSEGCLEDDIAGARTSPDGVYNTRPSVAADAHGAVHLLWRAKFDEVYQRLLRPQPDEGWTRMRRLGEGIGSAIAAAGDGVLHAAWTEPRVGAREAEDPCRGCGDIVYSRSADGGDVWSDPIYIAETPTGSQKPAFALGPDQEVYLVWDEGPDLYAGKGKAAPSMMRASLDGGLTWQPSTQLSPEDLPMQPAIAVAGDGTLVVAWRSRTRDGVFAQTSTDRGATWSEPEPLPGLLGRHDAPDELDAMHMATDAGGVVHLVATGRIGPEADVNGVFHLAWDGHVWTQPEKIFAGRGAAEWPRIAIANGNELAVVWFERDAENVWKPETGQYRIWYAHARVAAPARTPSVWPTPKRVLIRPQTVSSLGQAVAALLVLAAVIGWARSRGL